MMGAVDARRVLSLAIELELRASACSERLAEMSGSEPFRSASSSDSDRRRLPCPTAGDS